MDKKFIEEAQGYISTAVCSSIMRTERGNGTVTHTFKYDGETVKYTVRYYIWLDFKRMQPTWQVEVSLPGEYKYEEAEIENGIIDIVNDYICLGDIDLEPSLAEKYAKAE